MRWQRALAAADDELQMKYRPEVLILREALKATRETREAATIEIKTPAESAAEMLAKMRAGDGAKPVERENDGADDASPIATSPPRVGAAVRCARADVVLRDLRSRRRWHGKRP